MSREFFQELENFLPVFVSAVPSYLHSGLVFGVVVMVGTIITNKSKTIMDTDGDSLESATEMKMKKFVYMGTTAIVAIFFADLTFNISWKLRNKINRKHLVYRRWFPGIF